MLLKEVKQSYLSSPQKPVTLLAPVFAGPAVEGVVAPRVSDGSITGREYVFYWAGWFPGAAPAVAGAGGVGSLGGTAQRQACFENLVWTYSETMLEISVCHE